MKRTVAWPSRHAERKSHLFLSLSVSLLILLLGSYEKQVSGLLVGKISPRGMITDSSGEEELGKSETDRECARTYGIGVNTKVHKQLKLQASCKQDSRCIQAELLDSVSA